MLSIRGQAVGSRLRAQCSASHSLQPCAEGWGGTTQLCASNQHCLGRGESSSTKAPHWYLGFLSPNINNMRLSEDLAVTRVQKSSPELLNSAASCMFLVSLLCLGLALRSVPAGSAEQTEALCGCSGQLDLGCLTRELPAECGAVCSSHPHLPGVGGRVPFL